MMVGKPEGGDGWDSDEGDRDGDGDGQCKFDGVFLDTSYQAFFDGKFFSTLPSLLGSVVFWPFVGILALRWYFGPPLAL